MHRFEGINKEELAENVTYYLCNRWGAKNITYEGRPMF